MNVKIITNSGFKYTGEKISESKTCIKIKEIKEGVIEIPFINISLIKELYNENEN